MTKRVLIQSRKIEAAAEKAGGFVVAPEKVGHNPKGEANFRAVRQYSLKHGVPMSKLTSADYKKIGIDHP